MSKGTWALLAVLAVAGCATPSRPPSAFDEGRRLIESGDVERGLARVQEASKAEPGNQEYRAYYFRQRDLAVQRYLALAEKARSMNLFDQAEEAYRRALALDDTNARARDGLDIVPIERRHRALLTNAEERLKKGDADGALRGVREILVENSSHRDALALVRRIEEHSAKAAAAIPQLPAALRRPITLEFREAPLRSIFEIVSKQTGLNFIFDRDVKPDLRTTVFVRDTTIEDVIRFVLVTNQLERKILNHNTILIYPNTPAKSRDYQDLVVRSFYLANADVKQTANMVKALVKTRDMYVDEKLNLLVIRDTAEAVRLAERLIANQDLAEPEVMLEVEVLEVGANVLTDLGIRWPDQLGVGLASPPGLGGGTPATPAPPGTSSITLEELQNRRASLVRLTFNDPLFVFNLKKQDGRTNILANPRIRVKNKDKAKIHIGDKVPVITTTATGTGFVSESVNYLDVGLKLEVEPTVFLEDEVGIKIGLEVSNIAREIRSSTGTLAYQIGARTAATTLRLKDGETQVLAGLISDEERRTASKVPGLGDLPNIGRLFSSTSDTATKTEIVLLITPHVVRNLKRSELRLEEFPGGTEASIGAAPLALPATSGPPPASPAAPQVPQSGAPAGFGPTLVPIPSTPGVAPVPPAGSPVLPAPAPGAPGSGSSSVPAPAAGSVPSGSAKFSLRAPAQVAAGQEFTVELGLETPMLFRKGAASFVFDSSRLRFVRVEPGELLSASGTDVAFNAETPATGRMNLSFAAKADLKGSGVAARAVFQVLGTAGGNPDVRVATVSLADPAGRAVTAPLPAPANVAIIRPR